MKLSQMALSDFSGLKYQCSCKREHGADVDIFTEKGAIEKINEVLAKISPAMRIAIVSTARNYAAHGDKLQSVLDGVNYPSVLFIFGEGVKRELKEGCQLFGLPEDVRAVVILGNGVEAELARYYASVMNIPYIVIACDPDLSGVFKKTVNIDGKENMGTKAPLAKALIIDGNIVSRCSAEKKLSAYCRGVSRALCLIDYKVSALAQCHGVCREIYSAFKDTVDECANLDISTADFEEKLACANAKLSLLSYLSDEKLSPHAVKSLEFIALSGELGDGYDEYRIYIKLLRIYALFFSVGNMNLLVPNRQEACEEVTKITGLSECEMLKRTFVSPHSITKERERLIRARSGKFMDEIVFRLIESQKTFEKIEKLKEKVKVRDIGSENLKRGFKYMAEVSKAYTLCSLIRDLGVMEY